MLDLKLIRESGELVEKGLARRNGGFSIGPLLAIDSSFRQYQSEWEELNRRSNEISERFKTGKFDSNEAGAWKQETKEIKIRREEVEAKKQELEAQLRDLQMSLPNLPDSAVPDGKDEASNLEVSRWGEIPKIASAKHHYEIGTELAIFDFERGVKISESRFTVLLSIGAKIERALMNFMLDSHSKRGYQEIFPPVLVNCPNSKVIFINAKMTSCI
jgi:seryl-tRNA synthetase